MGKKKRNKTVGVEPTTLYKLLIHECRYAYTRNNHLMPSCAFDEVKCLLSKLYEADEGCCVRTAEQLCEECISDQLAWNFDDGFDDEYGNRRESIRFIRWCIDFVNSMNAKNGIGEWYPYNYDCFLENLAHDDEGRYDVYEIVGCEEIKVNDEPVSLDGCEDYVFAKENLDKNMAATYRMFRVRREDLSERHPHACDFSYELLTPVNRKYIVRCVCSNS